MATEAEIAAAARARAGKECKRQARVADDLRAHGWTCIPPGAIDRFTIETDIGERALLECECGESISVATGAAMPDLIRDALAHTC